MPRQTSEHCSLIFRRDRMAPPALIMRVRFVASGATAAFFIYDIASTSLSAGASRPGVIDSYGAAAGAFTAKSLSPAEAQLVRHQPFRFTTSPLNMECRAECALPFPTRWLRANRTVPLFNRRIPQRGDFGLAAARLRLFAISGDTTGSISQIRWTGHVRDLQHQHRLPGSVGDFRDRIFGHV